MTETPAQRPATPGLIRLRPIGFMPLPGNALIATYPATGTRLEVRNENFKLLAVHWSAQAVLGPAGELMTNGTKAAAYLVTCERIESEDDPRLKVVAGR